MRRLQCIKRVSTCTDQDQRVPRLCRTNVYHVLGESRGMSLADIIALKVMEEDEPAVPTSDLWVWDALGSIQMDARSGCLWTWCFHICMNDSHMNTVTDVRKMYYLQLKLWQIRDNIIGVPGWLSGWAICLWLRAWSWGPGIKPCIGVPAESLLLPLPVSLPLSLCL